MTRKEMYDLIVKLGLKDKVREVYKKNYTNCTNAQLISIISTKETSSCKNNSIDKKFTTLLNILKDRHLLLPSDITKIVNA